MSREFRWQFALLLGVTATVLLAGIGLRDPWPADEPRFALIARDMVESGQWLFPRVSGILYPDKPPLFFWVVAICYALTGSLNIAILLPAALAGVGVVALVTDLARRLWGEDTAIYCGALLLVMLQFPLQMKTGQIDGFLCLLTTLGLYGLARHLLLGPSWGWYAIAGAAAGLGIITKGVGFLPLLLLIPFAFARRAHWPVARLNRADWRWSLAPLALIAAVALWLGPMLLAVTESGDLQLLQYRDNILLHQTVTRYADSWGHIKPPWYLVTHAASWLWLPIPLLLPWLIPAWRRDLEDRNAPILLFGSWVILVLLFFSFSDGKRSLYIFPAAPAVALVAGYHARELLARCSVRRALLGLALVVGALLAAGGAWLRLHPGELASLNPDAALISLVATRVMIIGLLALGFALALRVRRAALAWAATVMTVFVGVSTAVYPALDASRSGAEVIEAVRRELPPGSTLGFAGWPEQFLLQWNGPAVHFGFRREDRAEIEDAVTWLSRGLNNRLLVSGKLLNDCFDRDRLVDVGTGHRREWFIADRSALSRDCRWAEAPIERIVFYRPPRSTSLRVSKEPRSVYRHAEVAMVGGG